MRPWIHSLSNILPKRPLRDDFLAQNTILSAQKSPAGRFSGSKYNCVCPKGPCGTTFWPSKYQKTCFLVTFSALIYMQSEAFRYKKSFEHSPKPSKHQKYKAFNDFHIKKCHIRKNVEKQFWPVLQYIKNALNSMVMTGLPEIF